MIRFIILFLLISLQYSYAQWESAGWSNERYINAVATCNGTMVRAQKDYIMTSSDLGSTWQTVSEVKIVVAEFAKNDNSVMVAAAHSGGVYLSSDCGLSWELISNGVISDEIISRIRISGDTIVAGSYLDAKVYVSTNLGESWELKSSGLPTTGELDIFSIAFENEIIFACVQISSYSGLYKSSDFSETWKTQGAETKGASTVFIDKNRVYMYAQGLMISEDMGKTWTKVSPGDEPVAVINSNADKLYIGTSNGVYCSLDDGNSWIDYGLKGVNVKSIDFLGDKVVASSSNSLYILESPDEDWQRLDTLTNMGGVEKFAVKADLIYAYSSHAGAKMIWMSNDIGETWELINPMTKINDVWTFKAINDKLYLGSKSIHDGGLYSSVDNGKSWQLHKGLASFAEMGILRVFSLISLDSYIFAGTADGLFHSTDNGENWSIRDNDTVLKSIRLFVSLGNELFISEYPLQSTTDYGETWIEIKGNGLPSNEWPISLFADENTLYAGFIGSPQESGVYISRNRGNNWDYITKNYLAYNGYATKDVGRVFAFDNYIFASTTTNIANFITADEGKNWVAINEGLPALKINAIKRVGDYLIVGTPGGFSRAKISDIADIIITSVPEELPPATQENTVYPNPTDAYLYIDKYEGSQMEYEIFDYAGKKVLAGTLNGYKIDVSALPAAAYIVVLSDDADKHTMKFIKK